MNTPTYDKSISALLVVDPYNDFISEGDLEGIMKYLDKEKDEITAQLADNAHLMLIPSKSSAVRLSPTLSCLSSQYTAHTVVFGNFGIEGCPNEVSAPPMQATKHVGPLFWPEC